jgi:hypothetical protein
MGYTTNNKRKHCWQQGCEATVSTTLSPEGPDENAALVVGKTVW